MQIDPPGLFLDHFFKQTREHHVRLSAQADVKANLMITVGSLVLTLTANYLMQPALQWAAACMIVFCMLSILCAILAVMPRLPRPRPRGERINPRSPGFNMLFFGSFISLSYDDYLKETERICNDPSLVIEAMAKEVYGLGVFLARTKYRYLRWSYQFFLAGMFSSVALVILSEIAAQLGHPLPTFFVSSTL